MKKIKLGTRLIGQNEPCFIIAEIGSNHNRSLKTGCKLIDAAKRAGADAVKFQSFTLGNWISKEFDSFPTLAKGQNVYRQLKKCELPYNVYKKLKLYAEDKGLVCFSSPSHKEDVNRLHEIGAPAFKFGSVQITDLPTIEYAARKKKPIILSTGGSTLEEIKDAIEVVYSTGNRAVILLHCTVLYPAEIYQINLKSIITLQDTFHVPIGYSDHTMGNAIVPAAAVAMGACVIEKHITLSRRSKGPDHSFAVEPEEFKCMVKAIRDTEKALGSGVKRQLAEEKEIIRMGRRSIVANREISKGMLISEEMLTLKRPGYGIPPKFLHCVIGKRAQADIEKDSLVTWKMVLKNKKNA
ncbi:MAG: N-acetylneuraminate synthase family protein [Candidatus Omnitrophica bacterium]|nr:N-acetylneuraminate synthase family protein [Candidatus Omnitrophota bacterium]